MPWERADEFQLVKRNSSAESCSETKSSAERAKFVRRKWRDAAESSAEKDVKIVVFYDQSRPKMPY